MIKDLFALFVLLLTGYYLYQYEYKDSEPYISSVIQEPLFRPHANDLDPMCNVIIYKSHSCGLCDAAMKALDKTKVRYCIKDINASKLNLDTYDRLSRGEACGPITIIGDKTFLGFSYEHGEKSFQSAVTKMNHSL